MNSALLLAVCSGTPAAAAEKCPNQDGTPNDLTQFADESCECDEGLRELRDTPSRTLQCKKICELGAAVRRDSCICLEGPNSPTDRECTLAGDTPSNADNCTCVNFRCDENEAQYAVLVNPDYPTLFESPCSCGDDARKKLLDADGVDSSESGKPTAFMMCVVEVDDDDDNDSGSGGKDSGKDDDGAMDSAVGKDSALSLTGAVAMSATLAGWLFFRG